MNISPVLLSTKKLLEIKNGVPQSDLDLMFDALLEQGRRNFIKALIAVSASTAIIIVALLLFAR